MKLNPDKIEAVAEHPGQQVTGISKPVNADTFEGAPFDPLSLNQGPHDGAQPAQDPHSLLIRLRMRFPGLPIVPLPDSIRTLKLVAGVAQDMAIPNGAVAAMFHASGPFYLDAQGASQVPTGTRLDATSLLITPPWPFLYYMFGKNQLSFIAEQITTVQGLFFIDTATK